MEREYYFLSDAAQLVGVSEADLIHFGATGRLRFYALLAGCLASETFPIDAPERLFLYGPHMMHSDDVRRIEAGVGGHLMQVADSRNFDDWTIEKPIPLGDVRLVLMGSELARKFPSLESTSTIISTKVPSDNKLLETIAALLAAWPKGKPPTGKDLEKAASAVGISISDDTILKALKAAREIAPKLPPA